jgi:hypothetical protein
MNRKHIALLLTILYFAAQSGFAQVNPSRKAIYESKVISVTFAVFDKTYKCGDSISFSLDYRNITNRDIYIYDPIISAKRSGFIHIDSINADCVFQLGGAYYWDLGRPSTLVLTKIKPYSSFHYDFKVSFTTFNHSESGTIFNDITDSNEYMLLVYANMGYISNLDGIHLIFNNPYVSISEANQYKEIKLFENNYCRSFIGPLMVKIKNL